MRIDYNYYDADKQISKQFQHKFTFETNNELMRAECRGYIPEYDIVRMVVKYSDGSTIDFPVKTLEEYHKMLIEHEGHIEEVYPAVHYYDIQDYE